ncbi:hypothetical protein NW762_003288 [Fusarium torreyae]|uniref:Protein kinase domain-containing protein n=1 Tax=Fusarium torreyae TaxID=1237075 RepID=A0A9W8VIY2_9HYPO|nr:hypothetical protein NW762_003288 [Fusarium torreyae]
MAELFSVAAPIIQLVSLAWTAVKQVTAITEQYKDKTALERRLNSLHLELRRLQEYAPRARATISLEYKCVNNVALAKTVADLAESIASCSGDLYALEKKVSGFFDDHSLEPPFYDFGNVIKPIFHKPKAINSGGTGQVFRVHYHFNYGDSCNDGAIPHTASSHLCYYAVKKLNSTGFHDFSREVSNLQRFTRKPHPHIVPLLGSYRMGGKYHLVFPWADCDLAMYWRLNPEPNNDKSMLEWVVIQMMGLADALSVIHGYHSDKEEPRWHGVHGDIKPANILCFSDNMSRPRLTLADFGSSHIHPLGKAQAPKIDNVKRTPVYRAPEVDIAPKGVTSACDIWSLGCVISETLVWMIKGNTGIQELSSARFDQAQNSPNRDAFFQLKGNPSGELAAQLKPDVQSVSQIVSSC